MTMYRGKSTQSWGKRFVKHPLEFCLLALLLGISNILGYRLATKCGGWLGQRIARHSSYVKKRALPQLKMIYPDWQEEKYFETINKIGENLGRVIFEYAHFAKIKNTAIIVKGLENIPPKQNNVPRFFVSGHFANWEVLNLAAKKFDVNLTSIYRPANNGLVDRWLHALRAPYCEELLPKTPEGAKALLRAASAGKDIGMLVDQKMNDGMEISFLGHPAMTAPAVAQLALKYKAPIIMTKLQRVNKDHFEVSLTPLVWEEQDSKAATITTIMTKINEVLGDWVNEAPDQWLWLHRRWGKNFTLFPVAPPDDLENLPE